MPQTDFVIRDLAPSILRMSKILSSPLVSQPSGVETVRLGDVVYVKPPSQVVPSTPITISSKPLEREPQSQAHADTLARHGIKVRDFAYDSRLPPIRPWHIRQIQPRLPLKRSSGGREDEDVFFEKGSDAGQASGSSIKKTKLERQITELDIQKSSVNASVPIRARGFTNLDDYEPEPESQPSNNSSRNWPPSQPRFEEFDSQDTEPYIDTPLVTPNGSLHWPVANSSSVTASQLDALCQAEVFTYFEVALESKDGTGLIGELSPMSSLSSILSDTPASPIPPAKGRKPPYNTRRESPLRQTSPRHIKTTSSYIGSKIHTFPTSPYQLRARPDRKLPQSRTNSDTRTHGTLPHPGSRPIVQSMQSSHSQTRHGSGSPRSKPFRKRVGR